MKYRKCDKDISRIFIRKFLYTAHFGTAADMVDVKVQTNFTCSCLQKRAIYQRLAC